MTEKLIELCEEYGAVMFDVGYEAGMLQDATGTSIVCRTCHWYRPDKRKKCVCPKMKYGYGHRPEDDKPDELIVEDDEGWGMIPGPEFSCVHHKLKGS